MSRSKATKRRKVWVEFDEHGTGDDPVVHFGRFPRTVPMVERLPGDVVLSREDVEALARALVMAGGHTYPGSDAAKAVVAAVDILRGRR